MDEDILAHKIAVAKTEEKKRLRSIMECGHILANLEETGLGCPPGSRRTYCLICQEIGTIIRVERDKRRNSLGSAVREVFTQIGLEPPKWAE